MELLLVFAGGAEVADRESCDGALGSAKVAADTGPDVAVFTIGLLALACNSAGCRGADIS